ncbi:MAG: FHA domain-containing protein [Gordonia sp. (in: high G+C Gram-positive bacteria)]|uniref:FHA domain-containing protein n=1 Tax=Gordonia sp. (in: high G+C Gram-positive bacteria) TaxID=84139 RepID=UPI0039E5D253
MSGSTGETPGRDGEQARVSLVPGDGVVIRRPDFLCVLGPGSAVLADDVLDLSGRVSTTEGGRRGRRLARAVAELVASSDLDGVDLAFAAPDEVGITLFLLGRVYGEIDGRRVEPIGRHPFERAIPWPFLGLGLFTDDAVPDPAGAERFDLVEGAVPSAGARLHSPEESGVTSFYTEALERVQRELAEYRRSKQRARGGAAVDPGAPDDESTGEELVPVPRDVVPPAVALGKVVPETPETPETPEQGSAAPVAAAPPANASSADTSTSSEPVVGASMPEAADTSSNPEAVSPDIPETPDDASTTEPTGPVTDPAAAPEPFVSTPLAPDPFPGSSSRPDPGASPTPLPLTRDDRPPIRGRAPLPPPSRPLPTTPRPGTTGTPVRGRAPVPPPRPPRAPLPVAAPVAPLTPPPAPAERSRAKVIGVRCVNGHLNHPDAWICGACGIRMDQLTTIPVEGERPSLGWLLLDSGEVFSLDTDIAIGRVPLVVPGGQPSDMKSIVVHDAGGAVSRRHLEVRLVEWDVFVVDLASINGTYVTDPGPGSRELRLLPHQLRKLVPGSRIRIGARLLTFESPHARL